MSDDRELVTESRWDDELGHRVMTIAGVDVVLGRDVSREDASLLERELKLAILDEAARMVAASHGWGDAPLPEDEAIKAAHPSRTGRHDLYQEAMRLVGARRGKAALVELVNWLLSSRLPVSAAGDLVEKLDKAEEQLEELHAECKKWKKSAADWEETAGNQSDLAAKEWGRAEDLKRENARLEHLLTIVVEKMDAAEKQLEDLRAERDKYRKRKDEAYEERNRLVALFVRMALALGWKAGIGEHEDKEGVDWHPEWRTLVVVETPEGQASWHFHDSHKHLLEGLPTVVAKWDGHDTPTKYERLLRLTRKSIVTSGSGERRNCMPALRPALATFAALCEQVLRDNDHKGGWEDESSEWLFERLKEEVEELGQIMTLRLATPTVIAREAADVANFAMMIADKHGWLPDEVSNEAEETSGQQSADDETSARGQGAASVEPVILSDSDLEVIRKKYVLSYPQYPSGGGYSAEQLRRIIDDHVRAAIEGTREDERARITAFLKTSEARAALNESIQIERAAARAEALEKAAQVAIDCLNAGKRDHRLVDAIRALAKKEGTP